MTVPMSKIAEIHKIDAQHVAESLRTVRTKLDGAQVETVLDFTSVLRIDPPALREMEALATLVEESKDKICLLHVNVEIYKVLKLAKLSARFNFRN
jgi:anti-anti-sigma regulatory factor